MIADCLAVILAGGDSRRMGSDKARLLLGEQSLLQHVASALQTLFPQTLLSVRTPRPEIDLPQICDQYANSGPLAGIAAALGHAQQQGIPWIFAVATDMPFLSPALIAGLAARRAGADAVVPVVAGHPQPMAAFYALSALPVIQAQLQGDGKHSLRAALACLQVTTVDEAELRAADPELHSFFDLDTPQDLLRAREVLLSPASASPPAAAQNERCMD